MSSSSPTAASSSSSTAVRRSPEIRKDGIFNRWVIFSPARARRPSDFKSTSPASNPNPNSTSNSTPSCPFCIGRENDFAPDIFRFPGGAAEWKIRVIDNLYPALSKDEEEPQDPNALDPDSTGSGRGLLRGYGYHDVVIETPYHSIRLSDLSPIEISEVLLVYKRRILQLASLGSIKYVQVFKNHGKSAGASMGHSHSQMIGLPLVPPSVSSRLDSMKECFERSGKCSLCEVRSEDILIDESPCFFAIVPFAASIPFEIWIVPRDHSSHFHELNSEKAEDLGGLLKLMLLKLSLQLNDPPFNFTIHTSPLAVSASSLPYCHWFLQIAPHMTVIGGFEIGSGCYINPVLPEDAAKVLREVKIPL